jgi:hypothetical protein
MADVAADIKAGNKAVAANWIYFLVLLVVVAIGLLWYEHKSGGKLTTKFASLPLVGKLFACMALVGWGVLALGRLAA